MLLLQGLKNKHTSLETQRAHHRVLLCYWDGCQARHADCCRWAFEWWENDWECSAEQTLPGAPREVSQQGCCLWEPVSRWIVLDPGPRSQILNTHLNRGFQLCLSIQEKASWPGIIALGLFCILCRCCSDHSSSLLSFLCLTRKANICKWNCHLSSNS